MEYSLKDLTSTIDNTYNSFVCFNESCINRVNQLYNSFTLFNRESIDFINSLDNKNFESYREFLNKRDTSLAFNFFDAVSDKWLHEDFHSDMLKFLLENDRDCFNNFLKFIGVDNTNYKNYEVKREHFTEHEKMKGRIDIEIVGEKNHIIIIENKIKWAKDTEKQLYKYYMGRKKNGYTVDKIIYLSPSKYKRPSDQSLGKENTKAKPKDIEAIDGFIHIISFDANGKDLCSCLETVLKNKKDDDIKVFLKHYIDILKRTGVGDMSVIAIKFLEELKNSKDKDISNKLIYIQEQFDKVGGDINKENLENESSKFFTEMKNSKDKNMYEKLAYMKEMLSGLAETRRDNFIERLKNVSIKFEKYAEKYYFSLYKMYIKKLNKKDIYICLDIQHPYLDTPIEIRIDDYDEGVKEYKEYKDILKNALASTGIVYEHDVSFRRTFKFPREDDKALEFIKEMDAILEKL